MTQYKKLFSLYNYILPMTSTLCFTETCQGYCVRPKDRILSTTSSLETKFTHLVLFIIFFEALKHKQTTSSENLFNLYIRWPLNLGKLKIVCSVLNLSEEDKMSIDNKKKYFHSSECFVVYSDQVTKHIKGCNHYVTMYHCHFRKYTKKAGPNIIEIT